MTKLRTSAIVLVLAAGTAAGVTGCSSKEAPKAKAAWNKAQDTAGAYKSLELKGEGTSDGKPATMTAKGDVNGGKLEMSGKIGDGTMDLITVDSKNYMKANKAFFTQTSSGSPAASNTDKIADKWLEMPADGSSNTGFKKLIDNIKNDSSEPNKKLLSDKATVSEDKVDGKDAWKIQSEDKKVTAWVSQEDRRDILKTEGFDSASVASTSGSSAKSDESMKTVTFLSHDKDYGIKAPSGATSITDAMGS